MSEPTWNPHDSLCECYEGPCCPWMGPCECQCLCDFIAKVREDERKTMTHMMETVAYRSVPPQCQRGHEIQEWRGRAICVQCGIEPSKVDADST